MTTLSKAPLFNHLHGYRVINMLREHGPMTKRDLEHHCHLSRPTLDKIVRSLCDRGVLQPGQYRSTDNGRRPLTYEFNALNKVAVGVDLEIPKLTITVTDLNGQALSEHTLDQIHCADPKHTLNLVVDHVESVLDALGVESSRVLGLAVGLPAFVNKRLETVTIMGVNLPTWDNIDIQAWLHRALRVPILVDNDVGFMAIAESKSRPIPEPVMLYLALRQGTKHDLRMGSAILVDGEVFHGAFGNAASLQGMYVELSETGDLTHAIIRTLSDDHPDGNIVQALQDHLVLPMVNMVMMFDPSLVVIHAQLLSQKQDAFVELCQEAMANLVPAPMAQNVRVEASVHKQRPGSYGAAAYVVQQAFGEPQCLVDRLSFSEAS